MKLRSQHVFVTAGAFAIVLALISPAQSGDSPDLALAADGASPGQVPPAAGAEGSPTPSPDTSPTTPSTPDFASELARGESAASVAASYAPNMIGDMGGGPILQVRFRRDFTNNLLSHFQVPSPSAGILGRQRFADNDCTLPTDRVLFDDSYFHEAELAAPTDANRFVPGFEKTFLDGLMSVEMRFPIGVLESNDFIADSPPFGTTGQFGDIQVIVKGLLLQEKSWTLGMGLDISVPTAPDLDVRNAAGTPLLKISDQSTHLLPYAGLLFTPNDDWFAQAFVQVDVAANGNPVSANLATNQLSSVGQFNDQTLLFVDASVGRWLYRNPEQRFSALAAVVEAHYTGGLNAPSTLGSGNFSIGYDTPGYNVLDLTVGAHAVFGKTTVTAGFATPVTDDRGFEGELRFFVNRRF